MATFVDLQKDIQDRIKDTSSETLAVIKSELNDAVASFMQQAFWPFSLRQSTLTTTTGISDYYLPADYDKMISFTQRNDKLQIAPVWAGDFERIIPDPTAYSSGRPKYYMNLLDDRVLAQPTAAGIVTGVSDSSSDLLKYASVFGQVAGIDRYERFLLSGQNFVSSTLSFTKVYTITLDLSCYGNTAFYEKTVGTNLLRLYVGETEREYKKIKLFPTPDGTYTLYLTYQAQNIHMKNDSDACIIPSKYLDVIKNQVVALFMLRQGDAKAAEYSQMAQQSLQDAKRDVDMEWNFVPNMRLVDNMTLLGQDYPFINR